MLVWTGTVSRTVEIWAARATFAGGLECVVGRAMCPSLDVTAGLEGLLSTHVQQNWKEEVVVRPSTMWRCIIYIYIYIYI